MNYLLLVLVANLVAFAKSSSAPPCPKNNVVEAFFPDSDCSKYWQCSNGIPYQMSCSTGLSFNPNLNVCDWTASAKCTGDGWSKNPTSTTTSSRPTRTRRTTTRRTTTTTTTTTTTPRPSTTRRTTTTTTTTTTPRPTTTPRTTKTSTTTTTTPRPTTTRRITTTTTLTPTKTRRTNPTRKPRPPCWLWWPFCRIGSSSNSSSNGK